MAEFFGSVTMLRSGIQLSPDAVQRAMDHCKGGRPVANLSELHLWMLEQNPDSGFFDTRISVGSYPAALAAFVTSCCWDKWKVHAVWALHGDLYLTRLKTAKPYMEKNTYRDNLAGASNHRAVGLIHMVRCALAEGLTELEIPCWDAPLPLIDIAVLAVSDMRTACMLRSEKYGQPGCSEGTVKAYQAALRNLSDGMEVHESVTVTKNGNMHKMVSTLRERATNLALTDQKMLAACTTGCALAAPEQLSVDRDMRLADRANAVIPVPQRQDVAPGTSCVQCGTATATHHGHLCRCLCLCAECVAAGDRVMECPKCEEFTEFVRA